MTGPVPGAPPFRCSAASRESGDALAGTASTVRTFLLLEAPGPWGTDAVRDSRLPDEVKERLGGLERSHRIRPLLVRRPGRSPVGPVRLFLAHCTPGRSRIGTTLLGDARELLDLDLSDAAGSAALPGLDDHDGTLFLVCTHGRHDACCAERGRPLCAALHAEAPEQTWEVSHIGGDRFAANVLVLPDGLYYGRLEPGDAARFAADHLAGRLDLDHLRGRSAYSFAAQAAEVSLRRHLDLRDRAPLRLVDSSRAGRRTTVVFETGGRRWQVSVDTGRADPRLLTCRSGSPAASPVHEPADLVELPDGAPDGTAGA